MSRDDDDDICPHCLINTVMQDHSADMRERTGRGVSVSTYIAALTMCIADMIAACDDPKLRAAKLDEVKRDLTRSVREVRVDAPGMAMTDPDTEH